MGRITIKPRGGFGAYQEVHSGAPIQETSVRAVRWDELSASLGCILRESSGDRPASPGRIEAFIENAKINGHDLSFQRVGLLDGELRCAGLCLTQPGAVGMILMSPPQDYRQRDSVLYRLSLRVLCELTASAFEQGSELLQMITDVVDEPRKALAGDAGFRNLTDLIYMARLVGAQDCHPVLPDGYCWVSYSPARHVLFRDAIFATYHHSLDCPELEPLREAEDVIQGHLGAGLFEAELWKLLVHDDTPAGILLQAPLKTQEGVDLTYMGVVPAYRGRQLGALMLQEGFACTRDRGYHVMTLALDCRNKPAYCLYKRMGFHTILRRSVLINSSQWR